MSKGLPDQILSKLSRSVAEQAGLHFPRERWPDLERGIRSMARALGHADAESCAKWLLSTPLDRKGIEILAGELTVGETYFFRETQSLDVFSGRILPELARARKGAERHLRLWSAGCCSGEEPYSLAIMLDRLLPDLRQWQVTILGTDINPRFLAKAADGIYTDWSFRNAPTWLKTDYFNSVGENRFEIIPRIKRMVTFSYLNLAEDGYPSLTTNTNAMDLIFCRNVLMYFSPEGTKRVVHKFRRSLVDQGWLVVSPTETSTQLFGELAPVQFPGVTFYQKAEKPPLSSVLPFQAPDISSMELPNAITPLPEIGFTPMTPPPPVESSVADPMPQSVQRDAYEEALALFAAGNYAEAAEKLEMDSASLSSSAKYPELRARICANLGDLAEAQSWVEKALELDKLDAGLHYLRAIILQEEGVGDEVSPALKRALYLDPHFVLAHFALGNIATQRRNYKEANRHFTNVLGLLADYKPDEVLPHSDGLAAGRLKEMVSAAMSMEKAA
jgi:chemotaxis protein methyltransferase CheR